jgi:hypothetical protein
MIKIETFTLPSGCVGKQWVILLCYKAKQMRYSDGTVHRSNVRLTAIVNREGAVWLSHSLKP